MHAPLNGLAGVTNNTICGIPALRDRSIIGAGLDIVGKQQSLGTQIFYCIRRLLSSAAGEFFLPLPGVVVIASRKSEDPSRIAGGQQPLPEGNSERVLKSFI